MVQKDEPKGLYGKYRIEKGDGTPVDPEAVYFTLRLDTDKHARQRLPRSDLVQTMPNVPQQWDSAPQERAHKRCGETAMEHPSVQNIGIPPAKLPRQRVHRADPEAPLVDVCAPQLGAHCTDHIRQGRRPVQR